jgi:hypothetical protein
MIQSIIVPEEQEDRLLTAAEVAAIWNEMAHEMGYKTNYTRFSIRNRRAKGRKTLQPDVTTPIGNLYRESKVRATKLFPKEAQRIDKNHA